jgi:steroid 5-alpha reductase family enzyme
MTKKTKTLIIIFFIYLVAITLGIFAYVSLNLDSVILSVFIANLAATLFIFLVGLPFQNASLYDPYWSVIPPVITIGLSLLWGRFLDIEVILLNLALLIWAIRLTYNWAKLWTDFSHQDWRYTLIKKQTKKLWLLSNFLAIHFFPTVIVYVQLIGAITYIQYAQGISWIALVGFVLIVFATYIQYRADHQMQTFKKEHPNQVMNQGLWSVSRHPNYLGEVSVWVGVYLFYVSLRQPIDLHIFAPIAMLALFVLLVYR